MSQVAQAGPFRLFDTDGEAIARIETDGSTLKPFLNAIRQVVDECRLHFTEDGLHVSAVEPSNVFMIEADLPASAFGQYDLPGGETSIGVNVASFRYAVRRARMNSNDDLSLRVHETRLYASVSREYDDGDRVMTDDYVDLIDQDMVRADPDVNLDLPELDVSLEAFVDATEHANAEFTDYLNYAVVDGDLIVTAKGDDASSKARIENVSDADEDAVREGLYSTSYLSEALTVIRRSKSEELTVSLGEQMPVEFAFERNNDDGDVILSGSTLLAPRVESGSEDRV